MNPHSNNQTIITPLNDRFLLKLHSENVLETFILLCIEGYKQERLALIVLESISLCIRSESTDQY